MLTETAERVKKNQFDLYDMAALALIWKRIYQKKEGEQYEQAVIDEAQDFGEAVYAVLRRLLPESAIRYSR